MLRRLTYSALLLSTVILILAATACKLNPTPPDRYALVYGVGTYEQVGFGNLGSTIDDAESVAQVLENKGYTVHLRLDDGADSDNKAATIEQFKLDIQNIASGLGKNDVLIIYFSGHGGQGGNYLPYSGDEDQFSEPEDEFIVFYPTSGDAYSDYIFSDTDFYSELKKLPAKKKVVLLDSCNSGGFIGQEYSFDRLSPEYVDTDEYRDNIISSTLNAFFNPKTGDIPPTDAIVITAAGETEVSWEAFGHGFLTHGFLNAVKYGDYDNNDYIDTGELYRYTKYFIEKQWNNLWSDPEIYSEDFRYERQFMPHISGGPVDYILFKAD
ncbi:MAG: caspase family protein [Spirochaetia bacterium]|nr:caspase family protein [Spirochaetia bacterium]